LVADRPLAPDHLSDKVLAALHEVIRCKCKPHKKFAKLARECTESVLDTGRFTETEAVVEVATVMAVALEGAPGDVNTQMSLFKKMVRAIIKPGIGDPIAAGSIGCVTQGFKMKAGQNDMFRVIYEVEKGKAVRFRAGHRNNNIYRGLVQHHA
jgi:hypothetical protein